MGACQESHEYSDTEHLTDIDELKNNVRALENEVGDLKDDFDTIADKIESTNDEPPN